MLKCACSLTAVACKPLAMACGCCEHRRLALLCPGCFAASCAGRRGDKHALTAQRDAAEQQLAALVADKVGPPAPSLGGAAKRWRREGLAAAPLPCTAALLPLGLADVHVMHCVHRLHRLASPLA